MTESRLREVAGQGRLPGGGDRSRDLEDNSGISQRRRKLGLAWEIGMAWMPTLTEWGVLGGWEEKAPRLPVRCDQLAVLP